MLKMEKGETHLSERRVAANRAAIAPPSRRRHSDVPCAAERPTRTMSRGYPHNGRLAGSGRSIGDFSLVTQRKVTRHSPKDGRTPFEGKALASCMAKPCNSLITRNERLRLSDNRSYVDTMTAYKLRSTRSSQ